MVKAKQNKMAFTLSEILIILAIIGILSTIIGKKMIMQMPDVEKAKFKNAYMTVSQTISKSIGDSVLYSGGFFTDTSKVELDTGDVFEGNTKFRDIFKYQQNVYKENITCDRYQIEVIDGRNALGIGAGSDCFVLDNGIVLGIPDTNFNDEIMIAQDGIDWVPVTIYTSARNTIDSAFVIGISANGKLTILRNYGAQNYEKAKSYLKSQTLAKKRGD